MCKTTKSQVPSKEPVCSQKLKSVICGNQVPKEIKLVRKSTMQPDYSTTKVQQPTQHKYVGGDFFEFSKYQYDLCIGLIFFSNKLTVKP